VLGLPRGRTRRGRGSVGASSGCQSNSRSVVCAGRSQHLLGMASGGQCRRSLSPQSNRWRPSTHKSPGSATGCAGTISANVAGDDDRRRLLGAATTLDETVRSTT
jgi:hypothetical protein